MNHQLRIVAGVALAIVAMSAAAAPGSTRESRPSPLVLSSPEKCLAADKESGFEQQLFREVMRQPGAAGNASRTGALLPSPPDTAIMVERDSLTCARVFQTLHATFDTMSARLGMPVVPDSVVLYRIGHRFRAVERRSGGHYRTHHVLDSAFQYVDRVMM